MRVYKFIFIIIVSMILLVNAGCAGKTDKSSLPDLGGVYQSDFKDLDFSMEISSVLPESGVIHNKARFEEIEAVTLVSVEYSNKLSSWGIKRNTGGLPPDADPGAPELLAKYGGIYIGDTSNKEIYLTFDEGYENGYTPKILDVLKENRVSAAFFITGPYLAKHQELVRRMVEEGHIVGNHTIHHPSLPSLSDKEMEEEVLGLDRAFYEKFGKHMEYLRPPKGEYSERTLALTQKLGYRNVFWSFAYDDWYRDKVRGHEYAYSIVMRNIHNGAILLLHAVSKDNADALDYIIKSIREKGYTIGSIDSIK